MCFPISKVNVIARLEIELTYFEASVQHLILLRFGLVSSFNGISIFVESYPCRKIAVTIFNSYLGWASRLLVVVGAVEYTDFISAEG